jgi:outer membrane protein OmpA-like peptidoglycan-associated protein
MKTKLIACVAFLSLISLHGNAQQAKIKAADKEYASYAYIDAIKTYEQVAAKGYKSVDLFQKLGNAYYFNSEMTEANKWYTALFDLNETLEAEYYYRYSQTLKSVGDYDKANEMLSKFSDMNKTDLRAKQFEGNKNYLEVIKKNSGRYAVENAGINSAFSDYGTSFFGNELIFTSNREVKGVTKKIQKWNNQQFTALFSATVSGDGNLEAPTVFSDVNTKFNEATPVFTNDGKTMYFTRNNYNNGKKGRDSEDIIRLKVYKAVMENGKWSNVTELPFNSNDYSVAHPALSTDEKTLYFSSDMPGTTGLSDIYKVSINADGSYGTPTNLGSNINTEGKETFPFVSNENQLYFASDGHPGLGGLDIFVSKINGTNYGQPINVGAPINGSADDFAFLIDTKTQTGFFSSNREGGLGFDDIYKFKENKKLECEQLLAGTITDAYNGKILDNAKLTLSDANFKIVESGYSDAQGNYKFTVKCDSKYYLKAEKKDYVSKEEGVSISDVSGKTTLSLALDARKTDLNLGDNIAKVFGIKEILFDLDKSDIRPDAALELEKIISVMKKYPQMVIDIRSHTDSRASAAYNYKLSERRARSTMDYMISQGIAKNRLSEKGYGESNLSNGCSDGVPCTEAQHQENRRSEFIVIKI